MDEVIRPGSTGRGGRDRGIRGRAGRYLTGQRVTVVEVNRPSRQARRRRGKSDATDAEAAARAALNGEARGVPKAGTGPVESLHALRFARRSAMKARTQAACQIRDLIVTAPDVLRGQLARLDTRARARVQTCARFRPGVVSDPGEATRMTLRCLARHHQALTAEIDELDQAIGQLCALATPRCLPPAAWGRKSPPRCWSAGDNPGRLRTEASFAALCGTSPVEPSSGKVTRHRLNQGGNREANNALWRIVVVRLTCDQRTRNYLTRRRAEGKTDREIIRCLKRYIAREIYTLPCTDGPVLAS
jgi:transposase